MTPFTLALAILSVLAPVALFAFVVRAPRPEDADPRARRRRRLALAAVTAALGAALFVPAWLFERWIAGWAGLDAHARTGTELASLVYAFFVAAPLEQGLKVAAVFPAWRARAFASPRDGVLFGAAAALGFVSAHNVGLFMDPGASSLAIGRGLLAVPAHLFFAGAWGYALGREAEQRRTRIGGRAFNATWVVAMLFNGVFDHIVFGKSVTALIATAPILLVMLVVALAARRSLASAEAPAARARPRRLVIAPPTLGAVRAALWRTEQPVMFGWIGAGALVTVGVISAALTVAVVLGRRFGVDFAAVDRGDGAAAGLAPLVLLGAAALAAFPIAGYLVARASSARGVLESAIAAALAIVGGLVLLGLAAPVSVVFALAFAPIALGLACAGAWMGITR
ncbi:MAG: PrsW family glutamic-type intramembrane protease [Minicystis sp.]